ncbi:MAG: glycoside hydrolase family 43 protein, partial [Holophagales bacterium]|nr:glycoside hydrolase family 43 protein [Holophagales bacterium]
SCGVWAPCLSHRDGVFYLLYTNVRSFDGPFLDTPSYVVTTTDVAAPWSEPTFLNASGFDVSLFHGSDGRAWLLNMVSDHRGDRFFGGIVLQEYDRRQRRLVGEVHPIFDGTDLGRTEGPHLYEKDGWFYLLLAEGGTGYEHAIAVARSREIHGPYEVHPENPLITSYHHPEAYLQKTGHGDLVETQTGEWYTVFLASRPLRGSGRGRCTLGRETALERIEWRADGWPYLAGGGRTARRRVEAPDLPPHPFPSPPERLAFDDPKVGLRELEPSFQSLRRPMTEDWLSLRARPGHLRLHGGESLGSTFAQSLVARRVQSHHIEAATRVEFSPRNFQQMAGLVCYYNTYHYHYLYLRGDDHGGDPSKVWLDILTCDKYRVEEPLGEPVDLSGVGRIYLRVEFDHAALVFSYATAEGQWQRLGPVLDGSILSGDYVEDLQVRFRPCFTGAFVGLCCQDLSGQGCHADFGFWEYRELEPAEAGSW